MKSEPAQFTEAEYGNARDMRDVLMEYVECGHIVDIAGDVLVNHVGQKVYGDGVWYAMVKRMKEEDKTNRKEVT